MPTDDGFGLDDNQRILPARPGRLQDCPEQLIQKAQRRPGPFPLQDGPLLAQGEDFDSKVSATLKERASGGDQGKDERQHGLALT
ncbi:MAG TPA: hypothetical protein VMJ75_07375 [Candidatus Acidoferrales bacterium]|nr:hypothetical protein [Candidatus Acidoferrales bacterium]